MNYLRMDLKVCEGCGVLWLRTAPLDGVYCDGCARKLMEYPAALGRRAKMRRTWDRRPKRMSVVNAGGAR